MELFPYQDAGAAFLASRRYAMLADEMGLGKTVQAVRGADLVGAGRVLVVCPASVKGVWRREFASWSILSPELQIYSYDELVVTARKLQDAAAFRPDVLVVDEAHYLKSPKAKRTGKVYKTLAPLAGRVWALTGTPMLNDLGELWIHCRVLGGEPRSMEEWVDTYCYTIPSEWGLGKRIVGVREDALPELYGRIRKWFLRRVQTDVLSELPPIRWGELPLEVTGFAGEMNRFLEENPEVEEALAPLLGALEEGDDEATLRVMSAAAPSLSTLRRWTAKLKLPLLLQEVDRELLDGIGKVVLFAHHREVINALVLHYGKRSVHLHGGTSQADRARAVDLFQTDPKVEVFIGNIKAAGTGITLHAASHVIFVESSWSPEENAQAAKRIHRIGQDRSCLIRMSTLAGSIDDAVTRVLTRKGRAITTVLGGLA